MYENILVPLENSETDETIIRHVLDLAKIFSSKVRLIHVADGFVARNQSRYNLKDSEEIETDRSYLEGCCERFKKIGVQASFILGKGDPADEILKAMDSEKYDLVAMATHGHRLIGDLLHGSVAENLRHRTAVPVLMICAGRAN